MGAHNDKSVKKLFALIRSLGFTIDDRKNGYKITPPQDNENQTPYFTHGTTKCVKPMVRDFRRMYNIELDQN